jgi:hypothetical protein
MPKGIAAVTEMTRRDSAYLVVIFADGSSAWNTHSAGRMASRRAGARHPRVECESAQMRNRGQSIRGQDPSALESGQGAGNDCYCYCVKTGHCEALGI